MPAVTLSGFNNIDFNAILEAVMLQERLPVSRLETQKRALEQQDTQLGQLAGHLSTLKSAADSLADPTSLAVLKATSSQADLVGVTAATGTTPGSYDVVVSARAKAQVTASSSTSAAADIVATGGTLQLLVGANPPVSIVVTGNMTLQQLADAINSTDDVPVTASVVQVSPGSYRLVLTGRQTGLENAFTVNNALAGGTGVAFANPNAVEAVDASVTVNNVAVTSPSNTLTDVIPGATLTLEGEDATETVHVTVARDGERVKGKVEGFVEAYNELVDFVTSQRAAALEGKPSVATNPMVRGLHAQLRAAVLGEYGAGSITRLAGAGIGFDRAGHMTIDDEAFDDLVATDPEAVQDLFAGTAGGDGAFDALETLVGTYTQSDGLVPGARTRLTDQVEAVTRRIDSLEAQLLIRRDALQREFIAADQAMQRLQSQVSSLSALGGQYRLF
ncbi:MAG TPA: flagellar filament capping protein FliD [Vicinamibacterales bacterium]